MLIQRKWLDNYSSALNALNEQTKTALFSALEKVDISSDYAESAIYEVMRTVCSWSTLQARTMANVFYDGLREMSIGAQLGAAVEAQEPRIYSATKKAIEGGINENTAQKLLDVLLAENARAAGNQIIDNAKRDPADVRFARVPVGSETCRFCIMLASRGFVYHSRKTAGEFDHYHAHCDCRVVPGFEDVVKVDGYDASYYEDVYYHPENHQEVTDALNARRRELYAQKKGGEVRSYTRSEKADI